DKEEDQTTEDVQPDTEPSAEPETESTETPEMETSTTTEEPSEQPDTKTIDAEDDTLRASPVARRMAAENRIDLYQLEGSGPEGRVVKRDVQQAIESGQARLGTGGDGSGPGQSVSSPLKQEQRELSGMRKTIAERMAEAKREAPHFYLESEVDMERIRELREDLNDDETSYSYNDFVMLAAARALCEIPEVNGSYQGDYLQLHDSVDLGFAVAVDEGLFTPVIDNAEQKTLDQIHQESQELIDKTRAGDLTPDDYQGGTFTISNLGMFDITNFSAVINPPQAAILAVGSVDEKPVVNNRGNLAVGTRMEVTLSCDHRAIDGVHGSRFLGEFKNLLEHPVHLLS
ncbi:MAG: dihydrolipoamide acetyltransferase family protein, partial [bacterium]